MKWYTKREPEWNDVRIVSKFLWLPLEIDHEVRWLCKATWKERYENRRDGYTRYWKPICWVTSEKER